MLLYDKKVNKNIIIIIMAILFSNFNKSFEHSLTFIRIILFKLKFLKKKIVELFISILNFNFKENISLFNIKIFNTKLLTY